MAVPLVGACGPGYDTGPDPLLPLLERARADAAAANALASSSEQAELARRVAAVRRAQARALQAEVDRQNLPKPDSPVPGPPATVGGIEELGTRLQQARDEAVRAVPGLPRHRAGLTGSVAAGCAGVQQLAPELGAGQPGPLDPVRTGPLAPEAVEALQQALDAEHTAVWIYETVTAFLPADFGKGLTEGAAAHRDRRDACERIITAAGAEPHVARSAYVPRSPVEDTDSAVELVATTETDAAVSWRGVLERTDDAALRRLAVQALVGSATRGTSWRAEGELSPAAPALPGTPAPA
jgi:hypothetical protein